MAEIARHYVPGADTNHFLGRCDECDAHYAAKANRDRVESWYYCGQISQSMFEAYMYLWATSAVRYSAGAWSVEPTDPEVVRHVEAIRFALAQK